MEPTYEQIFGIRLLAHQGIMQTMLRNWGLPPEALLSDLMRSQEALISSMLAQGITDAQIEAVKQEFTTAVMTLNARIAQLPDERPDPIPE
ncbi:hypothetical protein [Xanthomonas arboricola]|uniref:hypothetical protein n=1 Tax=Xanthomonas arboricola TaxID=56448 RepID=UPI00161FC916|nr:hypothetical protein [Xanthomonas arboricola]MBB3759236.1 hypothetical protein [Xanthomonas arboricola]